MAVQPIKPSQVIKAKQDGLPDFVIEAFNDHAVEVMITPERIVKMTTSPRDLFTIITALRERGYDPQVRVMDKEDNDWTCWQPTAPTVEIPVKKKKAA